MNTKRITITYYAWQHKLQQTLAFSSLTSAINYAIRELESRGYSDISFDGYGTLEQLR